MSNTEQNDNDLSYQTYPITVFIDTCIFESLNFAFNGKLLQALLSAIRAGGIRLVISEITRREIQSRLLSGVTAAQGALSKLSKEAKILKGLHGHPLSTIFDTHDWNVVTQELAHGWDCFIKDANAEILPIDGCDTEAIFDDYFTGRPPFTGGEKKSEFPDAFVIKSLQDFAKKHNCKVVVISNDKDFQAACEEDPSLIWHNSLSKVLENSQRFLMHNPKAIHALLTPFKSSLSTAIVNSFYDHGFIWDSDESYDSEVTETYDAEIVTMELAIIDVTDDWAEVAVDATIHFKASVQYPDPIMTYKDDETKEWVSLGSIHATLSATSTLPVTLSVNINALKDNRLEYDDLTVNDNDDIWIDEYEIEEIHEPDYSE